MVNPPLQNLIVKCNQRCIFQENKVVFNLRSCPILGVTQRQKEANLVIYSSVENRLLAYLCYSNNIYRQSGENIMFSLVMSFLHLSVKLESGLIGHLIHDKILESHLFQVHRLHRRVYPWVNPKLLQPSLELSLKKSSHRDITSLFCDQYCISRIYWFGVMGLMSDIQWRMVIWILRFWNWSFQLCTKVQSHVHIPGDCDSWPNQDDQNKGKPDNSWA
jgi:hypothetical protein